jgi:2-amino-4-hydroxy-6-hydroxymethyldihydropteridine diphosphokinase
MEEENLIIPHPRIQDRRFTLIPLNEIAPQEIHPIFKRSIHQLLQECNDQLEVKKLSEK